jgi:hypothetical protein
VRQAIDYDNLDPATLRWVAQDHIEEAERLDEAVRPSTPAFVIERLTRAAVTHRAAAKRLRALATRIENKRGAL